MLEKTMSNGFFLSTTISALARSPAVVAVIVAPPIARPITIPRSASTQTTLVSLERQSTTTPDSVLPAESLAVAARTFVPPIVSLITPGRTASDVGLAGVVGPAVSGTPSGPTRTAGPRETSQATEDRRHASATREHEDRPAAMVRICLLQARRGRSEHAVYCRRSGSLVGWTSRRFHRRTS